MRQNDIIITNNFKRNCLIGLFLTFGLGFIHCTQDKGPQAEKYYFPAEKLQDGLVYKYEMSGQLAPEYWYLKSFVTEDSTILTLTVYDGQQRQVQLSRERKYPSGWVQRNLYLYQYDSSGMERIEVNIINDDLYPFNVQDSLDVTLYTASWKRVIDGEEVTKKLFRNRRWFGRDTLTIMDERIPCLVFRVYDWIEDERKGTLRIKTQSTEYYGLNWGLVKKEQYIEGELFRSFHLADTFNMRTFEELYKEHME